MYKKNQTEKCVRLLENAVERYDRIVLFDRNEFIFKLFNMKVITASNKKILILSSKYMVSDIENITFQQITEEQIGNLIDFYFTYEFSDKFIFVSRDNTNYGGLLQFVDTGILSVKELFEALIS